MSFKAGAESLIGEAESAINHYAGWKIKRLIDLRENAVFEARDQIDRIGAFRIHRQGYQSLAAIRSELEWMEFLGDAGVSIPFPYLSNSGEPIVLTSSNRFASLVSWMPGVPLATLHEVNESRELLEPVYFKIGVELAKIHNLSDQFDCHDSFHRPQWDVDGFLGRKPVWGRFWDNPALSRHDRTFVLDLRSAIRTTLLEFVEEGADFGLIHADPLWENILVNEGRPALIDFDDCGFGFRLYDLAVLLSRSRESPLYIPLRDSLLEGYHGTRTLHDHFAHMLPLLILVRFLACLGWIIPRMEISDSAERNSKYVRTVKLLGQQWLESR